MTESVDTKPFRTKLVATLDLLLARPLVAFGDDRQVLTALRAYADVMPDAEAVRLMGFYHGPRGETP